MVTLVEGESVFDFGLFFGKIVFGDWSGGEDDSVSFGFDGEFFFLVIMSNTHGKRKLPEIKL
jgi:hypothetical protein